MRKRGLGKGLEALIPVHPEVSSEKDTHNVVEIPVEQIEPNVFQPRKTFDEEKLDELAASIKENGVIQPIVVRPLAGEKFELVVGERRWRACRKVGISLIPAVVKDLSDVDLTAMALIENIQREDLNALEEAWAYRTLMQEFSLTQSELSQKVGKSRSFIANLVRLLSLPEKIRQHLANGELSVGHARALLGLPSEQQMIDLCQKILNEELTVRETEKIIKNIGRESLKKKTNTSKKLETSWEKETLFIQEQLEELLNTKVKVNDRRGKGSIVIQYFGEEELKRILELIFKRDSNVSRETF